jgi:uncharacterized protein YggU (UPF0235/DUF167 family)
MSDTLPAGLRALAVPGAEIAVRATPNAFREQVTLGDTRFVIRVTCVPEDGKANRAVMRLPARALGVPPLRLMLVRGATGRDKVFRVEQGGNCLSATVLVKPVKNPFQAFDCRKTASISSTGTPSIVTPVIRQLSNRAPERLTF